MSRTTMRTITAAAIATAALVGGSSAASANDIPTPAYDIPNVAPKTVGGEAQQWVGEQYRRVPILSSGMECNADYIPELEPVAGQGFGYWDPEDDFGNNIAWINVTGWKNGPEAMSLLSSGGLNCSLADGWRELPGGTTVYKTFTNGTEFIVAARVGNMVVSSSVQSPKGLAEAKRIAKNSALKTASNLIQKYPSQAGLAPAAQAK